MRHRAEVLHPTVAGVVRAAGVRPKAAVPAEAARAARVRPKAAGPEESEELEVLREQNPVRDSGKKMTGVPTDHSWERPEDQTLLLLYR